MIRSRAAGVAALLSAAPLLVGAMPTETFRADEWGLTIVYPSGLERSTDFKANYFDRGDWRVSYAAGTGPGEKIIGLSLPDLHARDAGGESIATAELRVGASRDPDVVASCLTYGMHSGNDVEGTTRTIGDVTFAEVPDNSDSEMMKTIRSDDYRAVHNGACYAIDLVTFTGGTANHPPEIPAADIAKLRGVLAMIRFDAK